MSQAQDDQLQEQDALKRAAAAVDRDKARMAVPAIYIDRFFLSYWKGHVRLTLGERATHTGGGDFWRFAALLEKSDVEELIERLQGILVKLNDEDLEKEKK